jgi:hypothetical protein
MSVKSGLLNLIQLGEESRPESSYPTHMDVTQPHSPYNYPSEIEPVGYNGVGDYLVWR